MLLLQWRKARDLTVSDCAAALGISQGYLSQIERGKQFPRPEIIGLVEAATHAQVTVVDHWSAWCAENKETFTSCRARGHAAAKAYGPVAITKGRTNGRKPETGRGKR